MTLLLTIAIIRGYAYQFVADSYLKDKSHLDKAVLK
jgi:hypothetical protein